MFMKLWNFNNFWPAAPSTRESDEIFYDSKEVDDANPSLASSSEESESDKTKVAIERLNRAITHYEESMEFQSKSFTAFIEVLRWQSARFMLLQTGEILKNIGEYKSDSKISFLSNLSATFTYGGNALGFFLLLFANFKNIVQWDKVQKQIDKLKETPPLYTKQLIVEEHVIKDSITKQITSFISSNLPFLKEHIEDASLKKLLDDVDEYETLLELLASSEELSGSHKQKATEIVGKSVHAADKAAKLLLQHILEESLEWKKIEAALIEDSKDLGKAEFLTSINHMQIRYKKAQEELLQAQELPLIFPIEGKKIVERTTKALQKFASCTEEKSLKRILKISHPDKLTENEVKALLLEQGDGLKMLARAVQNDYLKELLHTVHLDVDRFQKIDRSKKLMGQALEKQKQKAQEAVQHIQGRVELVLQAHQIKKLLNSEKTDDEKLEIIQKILPNVAKSSPIPIRECLFSEKSFEKILIHYKTGFSLANLNLSTGHDLRVSSERSLYLEYMLGMPVTNDLASEEDIYEFSQTVFKHNTTLEQSVKNGLQALSVQKLSYAQEVEGGGPLTKAGGLLTKSIYLFSSLITLICIPLVASGVLTIPAIAILLSAYILQSLALISLGGGIAYWIWHSPKAFLQNIKDTAQIVEKIKPIVIDIFRKIRLKDPLHPSESDLANKRRELLVYERERLILQRQKAQPGFNLLSTNKKKQMEQALLKTELSVKNAYRELSELERIYLNEHLDILPKLNEKRLQDMVNPGFHLGEQTFTPKRLENYHFTPLTLVFPSLSKKDVSQMRSSLTEALSSLFITGSISTELEHFIEMTGISFKEIKAQIEEELYGRASSNQEYKLSSEQKEELEKKIRTQIERLLGQFFGGSIDELVSVSHLSIKETHKEVYLIGKGWYRGVVGKIKRIRSKWLHEEITPS